MRPSPQRPARTALRAIVFLTPLVAACDLVAGLDTFEPPGASSTADASSGVGAGGSGGNGGAPATTTTSTGSVSCAGHVLINEVQIQDDFIELYNPTDVAVNLGTYSVAALASGSPPSLLQKWDGAADSLVIPAHTLRLLAYDALLFPEADSLLDDKLSNSSDPTVIVLYKGSTLVDSVCVCSQAVGCTFEEQGKELCTNRALVSAAFHLPDNVASAGRRDCNDTDDDQIDFALTCQTPRTPNSTSTTCQ